MTREAAATHLRNRALAELKAAWALYDQKEKDLYGEVLFDCHLCLELALKSKYVEKNDKAAPFTHDLNELAVLIDDSLGSDERLAFEELNEFAVLARYGDEEWFAEHATKENAEKWLKKTKQFLSIIFL